MPQMKLEPQYLTDESGQRTAVVLSIAQFEELAELIEDLDDLVEIAKRGEKPTIPHREVLEELRKNGVLPD